MRQPDPQRRRTVNGDATATLSEVVRAQTSACALVLDLAEVDLIDARGLGVLVEVREWTQSRGLIWLFTYWLWK